MNLKCGIIIRNDVLKVRVFGKDKKYEISTGLRVPNITIEQKRKLHKIILAEFYAMDDFDAKEFQNKLRRKFVELILK
jgi:hypothetical protein